MKKILFDRAYYENFYPDDATQAVSTQEQERQENLIYVHIEYLQIGKKSVLDSGYDLGQFLTSLQKVMLKATITGVEIRDYIYRHHAWRKGSVTDLGAQRADQYDLVICNDILT